MNDYKGFKSQALDFNVYSDGIDVIAVTPQYALTRENNGIQYYSLNPTTEDGWESLLIDENPEDDNPGRTPTAEEIPAALKATSDAWWADTTFETLLKEYWNKANAYSNTLWTREETQYSSGDPTYSEPREDAGGSAISQWCLDNDRTLINGAHIATGTVTAQQIDAGLLNAAGVVVTSPGSSDTAFLEPPVGEVFDIPKDIQPISAGGSYTQDDTTNTYTLALIAKHGGLRLDLTKLVKDQTYKLKFIFKDLSNTDPGKEMGAVPVTRLGGNIGWPIVNFKILKATINGVPVDDLSLYNVEGENGGYLLDSTKDTSDIEIEFVYMGMNNPEYNPNGTTNENNYFYISPNRCLADQKQQTYTQITITEISCISRSVLQYIFIAQGSFIAPTETDPNWKNEFPTWEGKGSVWRRIVTEAPGANGAVIYNYSPAQLLTAGECARIMAEAAIANEEPWGDNGTIKSLGDWCKKYEVTILDGANLMTGTIDAAEVKVTNLDASQITAGMFTVGTDTNNDKELTGSEIIFQAGYTEGENGAKDPQVKIGGFVIDTNSIASGDDTKKVGIRLTSTDGTNKDAKVIQAGTNFSVDADGKIVSTGGTIGGLNISTRKLTGRLYNAEIPSEGVELGITTANHMVSLTVSPPSQNTNYATGSPETSSKEITLSGFGSVKQVSTTTSDGTTTTTINPLDWTLEWTSEKQTDNTYTYKAFKTISDQTSNINKSFEKINSVSITQIDNNNVTLPSTSYEFISTADIQVTGWDESKRYIKTSNGAHQDDIQVSPAIRFSVSGDSANITVSTGYLFTLPGQRNEVPENFIVTITNIFSDANRESIIETLQPAKSVKATANVATDGFCTATSTVLSARLPWLTSATSVFYIKRTESSLSSTCDVNNEGGELDSWISGASGIKFAASWSRWSSDTTGSRIAITVTYSNIPHSKPLLTTAATYTLTDTATANNYALYIGAPFEGSSTAPATPEEAPFKVKHDGTLELTKEIGITNTGDVISDSWLNKTARGYFNRITPGRLSVESSYNDGGGLETMDLWTTYSQLGAIGVRDYTSSQITTGNFMNLAKSGMPVLASEVTNASPASFVIAADTYAVHDSFYDHHGQVYIQGIAKPSRKGEDSSVSLTIGKRTNYEYLDWGIKRTVSDRSIKITPTGIVSSPENSTATLSGSWTSTSFVSTGSDINLKHEIENLPEDYTSLFDNLRPVRFKYNDGTSNRYHVGFIAQDVEKAILDSGLTTNDVAGYIKEADVVNATGAVVKEGTRSIRYGEFVALNTDQIQKLKSRVAELETTVAELTKLLHEKLS